MTNRAPRRVSEPWRPLLDGDLAERAGEALARVRQGLARLPVGYPSNQGIRGDSVLDVGRLGQAVFWGHLARAEGAEEAVERAAECLEAAIDELARVITRANLYAGFLGAGWVTEYLRPLFTAGDGEDGAEAAQDTDDEDPNLEIDEALLQSLVQDRGDEAAPVHPNLFGGLVGSGVYALERCLQPDRGEVDGAPAFPRFVIEGREPPARPPGGASSWCFGDPRAFFARMKRYLTRFPWRRRPSPF